MFNTLITNAAAVMPLNFPPKDRTVIPKINRSSCLLYTSYTLTETGNAVA